ncbi:MAG: ABC transporter permease [Oscillospiraceae bacterium]|nr:ABC transporter permease [Oscillospiraceae bacterium]
MKNNTGGTGTVFRYTVQQHYKTTSVRILIIILFALSVASIPLLRLIAGKDSEVSSSDIKSLYLYNNTGFEITKDDITADERYASITVNASDGDKDALRQTLHDDKTAVAAFITGDEEGMSFRIQGYYGEGSDISEKDCETLNHVLQDALHQSIMRTMNVSQEQIDTMNLNVFSQVSTVDDYLKGDDQVVDPSTHMTVNLFYSYAIVLISALAMSYIFQQCMEEKVSKLVESLLVSVSPAALLTGKILAVTLFVFGGIALIAVGFVISYFIAKSTGDVSFLPETFTKTFGIDTSALHFNPGTVVLMLLCILLAYFILAFFSGIVGSCCSKTEDTQQASIAVVLFLLIGYYVASFTPMMQSDTVNYFVSLFPVTSIFTALPNYICGKITLLIFVLALVIQAATVYLFAKLAGAVYRMMLLYRGGFPKPAQLIRMLRENRSSAKAGAGKEG